MPVIRTNNVDDAASHDSFWSLTSSSATSASSRASSRTLVEPYHVDSLKKCRQKPNRAAGIGFNAREPIIISGVTLNPTVVFDTFWRFAAERKALDDRRRAGELSPWTDDKILQSYFFCNTFRVMDKLSQYIIREVIEKGSQKPEEIAFRVILFNSFTKIETWELLRDKVGPLKWATYDRAKYATVLYKAKVAGKTLYTGAFQKPAPKFEDSDGYINHLILLEVLMQNELHKKCMHAWHMADVYEWLISFPSMGEFSTYQLLLNLSYSNLLNFHRNDFVVPGPGASSGLTKIFGKSEMAAGREADSFFEIEVIRWLTDNQKYHFERLGLKPPVLGSAGLPMDVADVEHTLCEVDKYARLAHPGFKGKRNELWRKYEAKGPLPKAVLPKAWKHPARKTPRVRGDRKLVVEKRYSISRVKTHRNTDKGKEYLVYWWGYPPSDATWEPEATLMDDAGDAVADYWARRKAKQK